MAEINRHSTCTEATSSLPWPSSLHIMYLYFLEVVFLLLCYTHAVTVMQFNTFLQSVLEVLDTASRTNPAVISQLSFNSVKDVAKILRRRTPEQITCLYNEYSAKNGQLIVIRIPQTLDTVSYIHQCVCITCLVIKQTRIYGYVVVYFNHCGTRYVIRYT